MKRKILLVFISCVLSVLFLEIILIKLNLTKNKSVWFTVSEEKSKKNGDRFWKLSPLTIYAPNTSIHYDEYSHTDELGFRYSPFHTGNRKDNYNVIMVGDSFTMGHRMKDDKTYPALTERILQKSQKHIYLDNAGASGYGLDQEYLLVSETIIPQYQPDLIVWNLHINDVGDTNAFCLYKNTLFGFIRFPVWFNSVYIQMYLNQITPDWLFTSKIYTLLFNLLIIIPQTERFTFGCSVSVYSPLPNLFVNYSEKIKYYASQLKEKYPEQKILYVIMPFRSFVETPEKSNPSTYIDLYPTFTKLMTELPFPSIDLNPLLLEYTSSTSSSSSLFLTEEEFSYDDTHLNEIGNEVIAEFISEYLLKNNLPH